MISERAKKLGDAMVALKVLSAEQLKEAIKIATKDSAPSLVVVLLDAGHLTFKTFEKFIASTMGIQSATVANRPFPKEAVDLVGLEIMSTHSVFPFGLREEKGVKTLALGMVDPTDTDAVEIIQKEIGCRVVPVLISLPDFREAMKKNLHQSPLEIGTQKEEFVVLRGGGIEEEEIKNQTNNSQVIDVGTASIFTAKTVQPKPGWEHPSGVFKGGAISFFGKDNKKFREEILAKLDLDPQDAQKLLASDYTREALETSLRSVPANRLQNIFDSLSADLKVEALMNLVIKTGVATKLDLLAAAAVSLAFHEDGEGEKA